jgi:hypothetical protein
MPVSKEEINKLKRVFAPKTCNTSANTLRQRIPARNWTLELRSNKNKTQKEIKCGARFENSTIQNTEPNTKRFYEKKNTSN